MDLGLASLRAQTRAAVSGIAELGRKDVERGLSRTLARTSQLRNFDRTGPPKDLLSFLRPRTRAAHSRRRRRATLSSLGDSALRGERGKLLVLLPSSVCSYMVYILGLTVLGTVVRELRGLKRFKCPGGDAVTGARGKRGKAGRNSGNAQIVGMRVWGGQRDAPGALWGSVTRPAGAAAYHRAAHTHKRYGARKVV
jgi:hypothetical protein